MQRHVACLFLATWLVLCPPCLCFQAEATQLSPCRARHPTPAPLSTPRSSTPAPTAPPGTPLPWGAPVPVDQWFPPRPGAPEYCVKGKKRLFESRLAYPFAPLFYWYFPSRNGPRNKDPLVLWMNGGPSCSSSLGAFLINGPYRVNKDNRTLSWNTHGWDKVSNMIFLDQPVNTGFSWGSPQGGPSPFGRITLPLAMEHVYLFLQEFLGEHRELHGRRFFLAGESFAGQYIPTLGARTVGEEDEQKRLPVKFKAMVMGNPWVSPWHQYQNLPQFMFNVGLMPQGLLTNITHEMQNTGLPLLDRCRKGLKSCNIGEAEEVCGDFDLLVWMGITPVNGTTPCVYDCTQWTHDSCLDTSPVLEFFSSLKWEPSPGVLAAQWQDCSSFKPQMAWSQDVSPLVARLHDAGVATLVYAGDLDVRCHWLGNAAWMSLLMPRKQVSTRIYKSATGVRWGQMFAWKQLTFLRVYNASHFVSREKGKATLKMFSKFLRDQVLS